MKSSNTGFMFFPNRLTSKTTHGIVPFTRVVKTDKTLTRDQQILELRKQRQSLKKIGDTFNIQPREVKKILLNLDFDFEVELAQDLQIQNQLNFIEKNRIHILKGVQ